MMTRNQLRVTGKVALKSRQQAHAKQIRQIDIFPRLLEHRKHAAVAGVDSRSSRIPFLELWTAFTKCRVAHAFPIVFHTMEDAHLVAVLQLRADPRQIHPHLDSVTLQLWLRTDAGK